MIKYLVGVGLLLFLLGGWVYLRKSKKYYLQVDLKPFGLSGYANIDRKKKQVVFVVGEQTRRYFNVDGSRVIKIDHVELLVNLEADPPIKVLPASRPTVNMRATKK